MPIQSSTLTLCFADKRQIRSSELLEKFLFSQLSAERFPLELAGSPGYGLDDSGKPFYTNLATAIPESQAPRLVRWPTSSEGPWAMNEHRMPTPARWL